MTCDAFTVLEVQRGGPNQVQPAPGHQGLPLLPSGPDGVHPRSVAEGPARARRAWETYHRAWDETIPRQETPYGQGQDAVPKFFHTKAAAGTPSNRPDGSAGLSSEGHARLGMFGLLFRTPVQPEQNSNTTV